MEQRPEETVTNAKTETTDRRRFERVQLPATADLTDTSAGSRVKVRVADLGKGGCYVDLLNPFPVGTPVTIAIQHGNKTFKAQGTVSYTLPNMGMGVMFTEIAADQLAVLEEWLYMHPKESPAEADRPVEALASVTTEAINRDVLERLITLLMHQGVITKSQAAELLQPRSDTGELP